MFDLTIEFWHIVVLAALIVGYGEVRANYTKVVLENTRLELLDAIKELNDSLYINSVKTTQKLMIFLIREKMLYLDSKGNLVGFRNKIVTPEQMEKQIEEHHNK